MKPIGSISQRLLSGSIIVTGGKLLAVASALIINILLTRLLKPEDVGVYYLLVSIVTMSGLAAQLGVHQAIVRALGSSLGSDHEDLARRSIRAAFLIVIFGVAIIALPYALGGGRWIANHILNSPLAATLSVITALWICGFAFQLLISQLFRGYHRIGFATFFEGTSTGIFVITGLAYIWLTKGQLELRDVLTTILGALLLSVVCGLILFRKLYIQTKPGKGVDIKGMLKISLPLFVSSTAILGSTELHILILGSVNSEDTVAIYGAAYRLAKFIVIPLLIVNSVIPPMIAQLVAQNRKNEVERVLRSTAAIAGIPVIILLIIVILAGEPILTLFYGKFYAHGANVLIILVAAQSVNTLTGSPGVLLMMSNHQTVVMKFALISAISGLIISLILVRPLGAMGIAFGVALGLSMHNLGMWAYCKYQLNINTHMSLQSLWDIIGILLRKSHEKT